VWGILNTPKMQRKVISSRIIKDDLLGTYNKFHESLRLVLERTGYFRTLDWDKNRPNDQRK
jgi:hypothetical protein